MDTHGSLGSMLAFPAHARKIERRSDVSMSHDVSAQASPLFLHFLIFNFLCALEPGTETTLVVRVCVCVCVCVCACMHACACVCVCTFCHWCKAVLPIFGCKHLPTF